MTLADNENDCEDTALEATGVVKTHACTGGKNAAASSDQVVIWCLMFYGKMQCDARKVAINYDDEDGFAIFEPGLQACH
jgi:hypothetical protein